MTKQEIEQMLRARGIQPTAQRVEVLYDLYQGGHRTADEVHAMLNQDFTRVSRATVYNTLNLLKSEGLVGEVVLEPGKSIFDANASAHYHLYNVDTHELVDIPVDQICITCLPGFPADKVFLGADVVIRVGEPGKH